MIALMMTVVIVRAAHAERLLDGHLLPAKLHGVDQLINDWHGPHRGGIPGFHIAIFPDKQHGEILLADLEVVPNVLHQRCRQVLTVHWCTSCNANHSFLSFFHNKIALHHIFSNKGSAGTMQEFCSMQNNLTIYGIKLQDSTRVIQGFPNKFQ